MLIPTGKSKMYKNLGFEYGFLGRSDIEATHVLELVLRMKKDRQ